MGWCCWCSLEIQVYCLDFWNGFPNRELGVSKAVAEKSLLFTNKSPQETVNEGKTIDITLNISFSDLKNSIMIE